MYADRMDWIGEVLVGFAAFAGSVGASAVKGDRVRDIPQVVRRSPWKLAGVWIAFSALYLIVQFIRK
jgi:hypothetical protein